MISADEASLLRLESSSDEFSAGVYLRFIFHSFLIYFRVKRNSRTNLTIEPTLNKHE